jgi:hypothetical protein
MAMGTIRVSLENVGNSQNLKEKQQLKPLKG